MNTSDGPRYISYFRVSTARQGRSGLGIDAQKQAVAAYLNGRKPLAEFVEIESGRKTGKKLRTSNFRGNSAKGDFFRSAAFET